jgi:cytochrome c
MFTLEESGDVVISRRADFLKKGLRGLIVGIGLAGIAAWHVEAAQDKPTNYGLGRTATEAEIAKWNLDVSPSGDGLPPGQGTVKHGAQLYAKKCAGCHGPTGVEGPMVPLVGGRGTLATPEPVKTVGSYWPQATTLYDYIYRAMPYTAPQSLTPDEVYSLVAWLLFRNGIVPERAIMDARTLPAVQMPNRLGFVPDPRPDVPK